MGSLNAGSAMFPCQRVLQVQSTKEVQCNKPTLARNIKMGHSHAWKCMGLTSAGGQVRGLSQVPSTEARPLPVAISISPKFCRILRHRMCADTQKRKRILFHRKFCRIFVIRIYKNGRC